MKILFCHSFPQVKELGAPKVLLELAEEMELLDWECKTIGREELAANYKRVVSSSIPYAELLHSYLQEHASEYDVVDYNHPDLPFARSEFCPDTLLVARSVMLIHHIMDADIPRTKRLLPRIKHSLMKRHLDRKSQAQLDRATYSLQEANLINVCNHDEKATLVHLGLPKKKIAVLPYGISRSRRSLFDAVSSTSPAQPIVAFVGTFDYRKGAAEFYRIVESVASQVPDVRFRLMGTKGFFQTTQEVLAHFPRHLQNYVEVTHTFQSEELPHLLADCSVGMFPSYIEGFGFGVLEMLAASVPVIAYDVPGPRMMLPQEYLVKKGDATAMGKQVARLLTQPELLVKARLKAKQMSQKFNWQDIAQTTDTCYRQSLEYLNPTGTYFSV